MVVGVTYHLKLNFLPSLQRLLYKNLWCKGECASCKFLELFLIAAYSGTKSSQSVCRAYHYGESNAVGGSHGIVHGLNCLADGSLQVFLVKLAYKQVTVFSVHDGFNGSAQHFHAILLQHACLV